MSTDNRKPNDNPHPPFFALETLDWEAIMEAVEWSHWRVIKTPTEYERLHDVISCQQDEEIVG